MLRLVWDLEADGTDPTKVHCIQAKNVDTGEIRGFRPDEIANGVDYLDTADLLIGHNIIGYDLPVLARLAGFKPRRKVKIRDTIVHCRYTFPNLQEIDFDSKRPEVRSLAGQQALRAWGIRLNCLKGDYEGPWEDFNERMFVYCGQDVVVDEVLYSHLESLPYSEDALNLEHRIAYEYDKMERRGFLLDLDRGYKLKSDLEGDIARITGELNKLIPPRIETMKTPAYWVVTWPDGTNEQTPTKGEGEVRRKQRGVKAKEFKIEPGPMRTVEHPFNPGSDKQIREYLVEKYGWVSSKLTESGDKLLKKNPKADYAELAKEYGSTEEEVLRTLDYPEAKLAADYAMVSKVYSMVYSGKSAWLKDLESDNRLRYRLLHIGCVTHRTSATKMIQQTPAVQLDKQKHILWGFAGRYGADCRSLFTVPAGKVLCGWDLAGIESRMLAHFLARYDQGSYIDQVLNGDIHQLNVDSIEKWAGYLATRLDSKPMYYGMLYGIGSEKQGRVVVEACDSALQEYLDLEKRYTEDPSQIKHFGWAGRAKIPLRPAAAAFSVIGEKVNKALLRGIKGMDRLIEDVQAAAKEKKYLTGIDGRRLPIRKPSAALNTLLQGNSGIVFKRAVVLVANAILEQRLDVVPLMVCHDEEQAEAAVEAVDAYRLATEKAIKAAGERYNLRIPTSGSFVSGRTWCETH